MTDGSRDELRSATLRGVRWVGIGRLLTETIAFAASIALARAISPASFGHAAIALIVVSLAAILGPAGTTAALVQRESLSSDDLETSAFLSLGFGIVLTLLTVLFAHEGAPQLFGHETAWLIQLAAGAWLISAAAAVPQAILQRDLRFQTIAIVDSVSALVGASTSVTLAIVGFNAKALVFGGLVRALAGSVIAVVSARNSLPIPRRSAFAGLARFSASVSASSLVYAMFLNVDYAILGVQQPARIVGYYLRAYQLGVDYQTKISQIMLRVAFPIYARAATLADMRALRRRVVRTHGVVIIPLLSLFIGVAPEVVPRLFGHAWEPSVRPAQIMAVAGMAYAVRAGIGPLLIALDRPNALLKWNVCELVLYAVMIVFLGPHGLTTVAIGVACFGVASLLIVQVWLLRPALDLPVGALADDVAPGVVAGAAILGAVTALRLLPAGDLPRLGLSLVVGAAVYGAVLRLWFEDEWRVLESVLRRGRSKPAQPPLDQPG